MSYFNDALRRGEIHFGDDFHTSREISKLFGPNVRKSAFRRGFSVPGQENTDVWLVKEDGKEGWHNAPVRGNRYERNYAQIVTIKEYNDDVQKSKKNVERELEERLIRLVFWQEENAGYSFFKFHGCFTLDVEATLMLKQSGEYACVYKKIADTALCSKAQIIKQIVSMEDLPNYVGKQLVVELSLKVGLIEKGGRDVCLWPGEVLNVESVSGLTLVARTSNGVLVRIPKDEFKFGCLRLNSDDSIVVNR